MTETLNERRERERVLEREQRRKSEENFIVAGVMVTFSVPLYLAAFPEWFHRHRNPLPILTLGVPLVFAFWFACCGTVISSSIGSRLKFWMLGFGLVIAVMLLNRWE